MKLVKLSLIAAVAAGAVSFASATPLEQAIKDVDVSGYARYRYDSKHNKDQKIAGAMYKKADTTTNHRFTAEINFKAALADDFSGVMKAYYDAKDSAHERNSAPVNTHAGEKVDSSSTFKIRDIYLSYTPGNTTVSLGRQTITSLFTDDMLGTGLKVVNTDIAGLTLMAAAYDSLEQDEEADRDLELTYGNYTKNLYTAQVDGSFDPVAFQAAYAYADGFASYYGATVDVDFALSDDLSVGGDLQAAASSVKSSVKDVAHVSNGKMFIVAPKVSAFGAELQAGYIDFKSKKIGNGNNAYASAGVTFEDGSANFFQPGEQILDYNKFTGKNQFWFVTAAYNFDKYGVGLEYIKGKAKKDQYDPAKDEYNDTKKDEIVLRASYAYSKKLKFSSFYSMAKEDQQIDNLDKEKTNQFRFEAKYSF